MSNKKKVPCNSCGTLIPPLDHERLGGQCRLCKSGQRTNHDPKISCKIKFSNSSNLSNRVDITFAVRAKHFLEIMRDAMGITKANTCELEAQRALIKHALSFRIDFEINDDHWGRTGQALLKEFEKGKAWIEEEDGKQIRFSDLQRHEWVDTHLNLGGFEYRKLDGSLYLKMDTMHFD